MMNKCTNCGEAADTIKTVVVSRKIYTGCDKCMPGLIQGHDGAAKYNRDRMKKDYQRDLTQPSDPRAFIKAYPNKARETYSDATYRKFS